MTDDCKSSVMKFLDLVNFIIACHFPYCNPWSHLLRTTLHTQSPPMSLYVGLSNY